jgi:hypothetical protein
MVLISRPITGGSPRIPVLLKAAPLMADLMWEGAKRPCGGVAVTRRTRAGSCHAEDDGTPGHWRG